MLLTTLLLASGAAAQRWGPGVVFSSKSEILKFEGTLRPGHPPKDEADFVAIWPGLWNGKMGGYDLVQAVTSSHKRSYMQGFCGAKPGQWCTQAYVLRTGRPVTTPKGIAVNPDDQLTILYEKTKGQWYQKSMLNDKVIAELTAGDKSANKLDFQTEMQKTAKGTGDDQIYTNITIVLRESEPGFGNSARPSKGARVKGLKAVDDGKTWKIDEIFLPAMIPGTSTKNAARGGDAKKAGGGGAKKENNSAGDEAGSAIDFSLTASKAEPQNPDAKGILPGLVLPAPPSIMAR